MRTLTPYAEGDTARLLAVLSDEKTTPDTYKQTMTALGRLMATNVLKIAQVERHDTVCVVCTVEDADFLAKGLVDGLEAEGVDADHLKLICFWNERVHSFTGSDEKVFDVAPIIKEYKEDVNIDESVLIVIKSIISGACVVKTNLSALIETTLPKRVVVAAPVMLEGAEAKLASEFSSDTAQLFQYVTFALDTDKGDDDNVIPGIGGSVYERLGFDDKNAYVPEIVKNRRRDALGI
tara:strand:+ start:5965 stop:6672 length:708 start_codon:yes stop_codon:yes gene_type:complete